MLCATPELLSSEEQTEFNLRRWTEIHADPGLRHWEGRIETDQYGNILTSPPPNFNHGKTAFTIAKLLESLVENGEASVECPVSTPGGVKAVDVIWISNRRRKQQVEDPLCLTKAPEICVEVLSPRNRPGEMADKKALYFEAGAKEVWFCDGSRNMVFYTSVEDAGSRRAALCPDFPRVLPPH
jgi:Uma2 family endonuclease